MCNISFILHTYTNLLYFYFYILYNIYMSRYNKSLKLLKDKAIMLNREWYSLQSILGVTWAIFYFLIGGREAGKSYAVTECYIRQWRHFERPFYWLRLSESSQKILLKNNAEKLVDPDLRRKYNLDLVTLGDGVYEVIQRDKNNKIVKKKLMARVLALSTFYNDKGSGLFDKDFLNDPKMYYNIALDEMNREKSERKSFDILYAFTNQLENLVRSTKTRVRVICIGNTLEEASDILCSFNFQPENFGRYYIHQKRAVIEYIEPTEKYLTRRKGTIADILMPDESTFTNKINVDHTLVSKERLFKPNFIIRFRKNLAFTVWNSNLIAQFNGEKCKNEILMRPYLDGIYDNDAKNQIFQAFDGRAFKFRNLITFVKFKKELELLRPSK